MNRDFAKTLIVFSLFFIAVSLFLSNFDNREPLNINNYFIVKRASRPALTYLPGVLDLRGFKSVILGTESEVDPTEVVKFVNAERVNLGESELGMNESLSRAALMRAETILRHQHPYHTDPFENIQLDTVLPAVNYPYSYASENIALAQGNAAGFVAGWMQSPSHKENILNPALVETGVGVTYGKVGDYYSTIVVQLFAIPAPVEVYRGYKDEDVKNVSGFIAGVDNELTRTNSYLEKGLGDQNYYLGWKKVLERQKEILALVYSYMQTGQPYSKEQYDLIAEYNSNWAQAPK